MITYDTEPDRYRHWKLSIDAPVATLTLTVDEDGGIKDGYKLKLNSYDLGVDIVDFCPTLEPCPRRLALVV